MRVIRPIAILLCLVLGFSMVASADQMLIGVSLTTNRTITFSGSGNVDGTITFESGSVGESFIGQSVGSGTDINGFGFHDALAGSPSNPLTLQVGAPCQNLFVDSGQLAGVGPVGSPGAACGNADDELGGVGEGSFAILFGLAQSEFGFDIVGGQGGLVGVDFFTSSGSAIGSTMVLTLADSPGTLQTFTFRHTDDTGLIPIQDITGFSVYNVDPDGIGITNLQYNAPTTTNSVPEPATLLLLGPSLLGLAGIVRRKKKM